MWHGDRVPNDALREAFVVARAEDRVSTSDICRRMGWVKRSGEPDQTTLARRLGLRVNISGSPRGRNAYPQRTIASAEAARLADLLGLDPVEVGV